MGHQSFSEKSQTRQVLQLVFDHLAAGSGVTLTRANGILTITATGGGGSYREIRKDFHSVSAGDELYAYVSGPLSLTGVSLLAKQSGDLVVDVRRTPIGSFPATGGDSICAAAKPTLANAQTYLDTTLTGWSTGSIEGDTLTIHVDSVTTVTDFEITLYGQAVILPLVITGHLPDATIGDMASYSYTVTGGYGTTTVTIYSGALPAGASISTAGAVSGTYTTGGSYSWVLQVEDSLGSKAYLSDSNAIAYATLSSTGALTDADVGDPVGGSITLSGGDGTYTVDASPVSGTRPPGNGLALVGAVYSDSTGSLTTAGTYSWTDRFRSGDGQALDLPSSITVSLVVNKWNPSDKGANLNLSNSDLTVTRVSPSSVWSCVRGTIGRSSGKYAFRLKQSSTSGPSAGDDGGGIATASASLAVYPGQDAYAYAHLSDGYKAHSGYSAYGSNWAGLSDELMVVVDLTAGKIWFGKNGTLFGGDPVAGTGAAFTGMSAGTYFPIAGLKAGELTFLPELSPPTGYVTW